MLMVVARCSMTVEEQLNQVPAARRTLNRQVGQKQQRFRAGDQRHFRGVGIQQLQTPKGTQQ